MEKCAEIVVIEIGLRGLVQDHGYYEPCLKLAYRKNVEAWWLYSDKNWIILKEIKKEEHKYQLISLQTTIHFLKRLIKLRHVRTHPVYNFCICFGCFLLHLCYLLKFKWADFRPRNMTLNFLDIYDGLITNKRSNHGKNFLTPYSFINILHFKRDVKHLLSINFQLNCNTQFFSPHNLFLIIL